MTDEPLQTYIYCQECINELPEGADPLDYQKLACGFTSTTLVVRCVRHNFNLVSLDPMDKSSITIEQPPNAMTYN